MNSRQRVKASLQFQELDYLRGLAAVLMIINHAGYDFLSSELTKSGFTGTLVFLGSFAPVLFFLVTGIGYGVQSNKGTKERWGSLTYKVVILLIADQFLAWRNDRWLGLDFLGFIGFSSLVMAVVRSSKKPIVYSVAGFVGVFCLRYIVGPVVSDFSAIKGFLAWVLGNVSVRGISYPLSPWLGYPFFGYLIGVAVFYYYEPLKRYQKRVLLYLAASAVFLGIAVMVLAHLGISFRRWGIVGLGFYIASFAVIFTSLGVVLAVGTLARDSRFKIVPNYISLRGVSSLAVVPVHYYVIKLVQIPISGEVGVVGFLLICVLIIVISFMVARLIGDLSKTVSSLPQSNSLWRMLVALVVVSALLTLTYNDKESFLVSSSVMLGQTALCLILGFR